MLIWQIKRSISFFLTVLLFGACGRTVETSNPDGPGCIENYDPGRNYFPDRTQLEFARNLSVRYENSYKVVTVRRPADGGGVENYVLVQCGAPRPALEGELANADIISVPIRSLYSASSTHIQPLVEFGHIDVLAGVAQSQYITSEPARELIQQGRVIDYAPNDVIDTELIILKQPSVVMSSGGYPEAYNALSKAGIPVVTNVEWQESTALARAEWMKFTALFLNEERKAQEEFSTIRDRYLVLKERTSNLPEQDRPRVMTGTTFRGMFSIAGGASYVSGLISDAGGTYVWSDNKASGTAYVDLEAQIARAADAEFWINGGEWASLKAMLSEEPRYRQFRSFQIGNVWLYDGIRDETKPSDYWSRGITRPDLILGDLIKIFHPELAQDHEFVWYRRVPPE